MTSSLPCGQTSLLLQMTERLALSDAHFRRISQLIYQRAGIVLADHKRDMVYNRLVRRLRSLGLTDFGHYLNLLESNQHSGEWQAFINSLTTNLTAFFREAHHFPLLADHARRRSGEYRVWSAAASTGEEPYSIAMTPGPFDAIFCRNVMIYFDQNTQQEILRRFVPLLKPDGLLFAGHSENFSHLERRFTLRGQTVYALSKD
ncbi:CheR family methyltransferase [Escherichia coli]|uniref:CheR family methyltransferase n=1 Tax=Escherichia coli TaxID=562 RepID=UPI002FBD5741